MEITPIVKTNFLTFDADSSVSSMIGKLSKSKQRSGLIFKNDIYKGIIEKKRLLKTKLDTSEAKLSSFIQKTPLVNEHADLIETAYLMFNSNLDCLPVESNKEIIGIIESFDLARIAAYLPELKKLKVKDIKLLKLPKVNKEDPLATIINIMYKHRVEQVPLFEKGKLFGIISYRDVLQKYLSNPPQRTVSTKFTTSKAATPDTPSLPSLPASSFSTNDNLVTVDAKESLKNALSLMFDKNVSSALVMKWGEFEGLLTVKNILKTIASFKIPQNFNIKFIGLNKLDIDSYEIKSIKKITSNEAFKLQRSIKNDFLLTVHIKEYSKTGRQHKYSVHLRLEFPGQIVAVDQEDWDLRRAFHKAFRNAENKVEKMFVGRDINFQK